MFIADKDLSIHYVNRKHFKCDLGETVLPEWVCLKCGYKWVDESKVEPRYCPTCGSPNIYVPKIVKKT